MIGGQMVGMGFNTGPPMMPSPGMPAMQGSMSLMPGGFDGNFPQGEMPMHMNMGPISMAAGGNMGMIRGMGQARMTGPMMGGGQPVPAMQQNPPIRLGGGPMQAMQTMQGPAGANMSGMGGGTISNMNIGGVMHGMGGMTGQPMNMGMVAPGMGMNVPMQGIVMGMSGMQMPGSGTQMQMGGMGMGMQMGGNMPGRQSGVAFNNANRGWQGSGNPQGRNWSGSPGF